MEIKNKGNHGNHAPLPMALRHSFLILFEHLAHGGAMLASQQNSQWRFGDRSTKPISIKSREQDAQEKWEGQ